MLGKDFDTFVAVVVAPAVVTYGTGLFVASSIASPFLAIPYGVKGLQKRLERDKKNNQIKKYLEKHIIDSGIMDACRIPFSQQVKNGFGNMEREYVQLHKDLYTYRCGYIPLIGPALSWTTGSTIRERSITQIAKEIIKEHRKLISIEAKTSFRKIFNDEKKKFRNLAENFREEVINMLEKNDVVETSKFFYDQLGIIQASCIQDSYDKCNIIVQLKVKSRTKCLDNYPKLYDMFNKFREKLEQKKEKYYKKWQKNICKNL